MRFFGKKNYRSHNGVADMEVWLPAEVFRVLLASSLVSGGIKARRMFGKNTTLFLTSIVKYGRIQRPSCQYSRPFLPTRHVGLPDKVHHFVRRGVGFRTMKWAYFFGKVHHYCPFSSSLGIGSKTNSLEINALQKWRKKPLLQASCRRTANFCEEDGKNREKCLQKRRAHHRAP